MSTQELVVQGCSYPLQVRHLSIVHAALETKLLWSN
jgi:hypothetical protein